MDSRGVGPRPDDGGRRHVCPRASNAEQLHREDRHETYTEDEKAHGLEAGRIEDRDDEDGADVVDDRQGEQQDPERRGHTAAQQGQHPTAKAMSVAIGMPQPLDGSRPQLSSRKSTPEPASRRRLPRAVKRRSAQLAQLAPVDLATDLEPDDEEEDRHHPVVDPEMQIALEGEGTQPHAEAEGARARRSFRPGRVCPDQRDGGGGEEENSARRFDGEESLDWSQGALSQLAGGPPATGRASVGSGGGSFVSQIGHHTHARPENGGWRPDQAVELL